MVVYKRKVMLLQRLIRYFLFVSVIFSGAVSCQHEQNNEQNKEEGSDAVTRNVITLEPTITYQTITGWEAVGWLAQFDDRYQIENVHKWENIVADLAVNDVGINRVRLEIWSGAENPVDYFTQYINNQISHAEWKSHWHESINDNNDPLIINSTGFQFSLLDYNIDHVILPLKTELETNGEKLYVNLNYVDFRESSFEHYNNPNEYAEFILAVFRHLNSKYGWVPDALEVILEPDVASGWSAVEVGNALVAAAQILKINNYTPDFIAPSNTSMSVALSYFDEMVSIPDFLDYVSELSYHRYRGVSTSTLEAIARRGNQYGVGVSMLEWWSGSNTRETLHEDLKIGNNSAWQRGVLAGISGCKTCLYYIDTSDPDNPTVVMKEETKFMRQYFRFIRRGAVRIEVTTSNNSFDPVAFINTNGKYFLVVKADLGGSFLIQGLASGTYGIKYTTENQYDIDLENVTIDAGQTVDVNIPDSGVITIYAKE